MEPSLSPSETLVLKSVILYAPFILAILFFGIIPVPIEVFGHFHWSNSLWFVTLFSILAIEMNGR